MSNQKEHGPFINGIVGKVVWRKDDRFLVGLGFKKEVIIKELQALPANENGFINLTMGTQKDDTSKISTWVDTFVKTGQQNAPKPNTGYDPSTSQSNDSSDLPF